MVYRRDGSEFEIGHIYSLGDIHALINNFSERCINIDWNSSLEIFCGCSTNDPFEKPRKREIPLGTPLRAEYHSQSKGYKLRSFPKTKSILEIVLETDIVDAIGVLRCSIVFKGPGQESGRDFLERAESVIRGSYQDVWAC